MLAGGFQVTKKQVCATFCNHNPDVRFPLVHTRDQRRSCLQHSLSSMASSRMFIVWPVVLRKLRQSGAEEERRGHNKHAEE